MFPFKLKPVSTYTMQIGLDSICSKQKVKFLKNKEIFKDKLHFLRSDDGNVGHK